MPCCRFPLAALACCAALSAPAQSPKTDPADAAASVPPLAHRSSLSGYKRLGEPTTADWIGANQTVERIGGWRAYAREANAPAPSASAPSAASAPETMRIPRAPAPAHRH